MGKRGPPREGPSREELEPALREWREQLLTAEQTEQAALQKFGWTVKSRTLDARCADYGIPLKSYYRQQRNAAFEPQHDEAAVEHSPLERKSTEEAQSAGGEDEAGTKKRRLLAKLMENRLIPRILPVAFPEDLPPPQPRKTRILLGSTKAVAPSSSPPQHSSASHVFTLPNVGASSSSTTSSPLLDVEPPSSLSAALLGGSSEATTEEADQLYKLPARRQAEETSGHVRGLNCGVGLEGTAKEVGQRQRDYILGLDRRGYEQNRMGLTCGPCFVDYQKVQQLPSQPQLAIDHLDSHLNELSYHCPNIRHGVPCVFSANQARGVKQHQARCQSDENLYIGVVVKGKVKYVKTGSVAPAAVRATVEQQIKQPPTVRAKPVVGGARLGGKKAVKNDASSDEPVGAGLSPPQSPKLVTGIAATPFPGDWLPQLPQMASPTLHVHPPGVRTSGHAALRRDDIATGLSTSPPLPQSQVWSSLPLPLPPETLIGQAPPSVPLSPVRPRLDLSVLPPLPPLPPSSAHTDSLPPVKRRRYV